MNEMYALQILSVLIPHILACFEHIFPSQKTKKKGKAVTLKVGDPTSQETLLLLRENLSPDLCEIFQESLDLFSTARLIASTDDEQVDVSEQLSKLKAGTGR